MTVSSSGFNLDTLAQSKTGAVKYNELEIIYGTGACKDSIRKRPKRKFIDQAVCLALIDIAKKNEDDLWVKRYWNTYNCQQFLITHEGRAYGKYCKNRCCSICNAIRKADLIHKYKPIIESWDSPHLLL